MGETTINRKPDGWFVSLSNRSDSGPFKTRDDARAARKAHLAQARLRKQEAKAPSKPAEFNGRS